MRHQAFLVAESLVADVALERPGVLMDGLDVPLQTAFSVELLSTCAALCYFSVHVRAHVEVQGNTCSTRDVTFCAFVRLIEYACQHMRASVLFVLIHSTTVLTLLPATMHDVFVHDNFSGAEKDFTTLVTGIPSLLRGMHL